MTVAILQRGDDRGWRCRMDHTALWCNTCAVTWPQINLLSSFEKPDRNITRYPERSDWWMHYFMQFYPSSDKARQSFSPRNAGTLEGISWGGRRTATLPFMWGRLPVSWWKLWKILLYTGNRKELSMGAEYTQRGKGCLFLCVAVGHADSSRHISAPLQDPAAFPAVMWCEYLQGQTSAI